MYTSYVRTKVFILHYIFAIFLLTFFFLFLNSLVKFDLTCTIFLLLHVLGCHPTLVQKEHNKRMSSVRESVEWGFKLITTQWAFLNYKNNMKIFLQPVGKYYKLAAFLTNVHTCFEHNQISTYFDVAPPTLDEYLNWNAYH